MNAARDEQVRNSPTESAAADRAAQLVPQLDEREASGEPQKHVFNPLELVFSNLLGHGIVEFGTLGIYLA